MQRLQCKKSKCDDMSDPDDELIDWIKELKNRKDSLEERLLYLQSKEDVLKMSLLNPIIALRRASKESGGGSSWLPGGSNQNYLQNSLIGIRNWVERFYSKDSNPDAKKELEESLNKAITWASMSDRVEEDSVLRQLLSQSMMSAFNWVNRLNVSDDEEYIKQTLKDILKEGIEWTAKPDGDDEQLVQTMVDYIIVASNWTKLDETYDDLDEKIDKEVDTGSEVDELEVLKNERKGWEELNQYVKDIYEWVGSIHPTPEEKTVHRELMDSLTMLVQWTKTAAATYDDEVVKGLLNEILVIALTWVMSLNDDDNDQPKQQLIDTMLFAISWANSDDTRGNDVVMRRLLRRTLRAAMEWKEKRDEKEEITVQPN